ncbi:MAG: helix-turn-helix domain-containing protein [Actinobacteria bacterium]|nr:helix-turn-helix domain-containing protein [Actinomycetota bacterium]MBM3712037.1 helix-turn-helix domain-containing protein [Actinomycetota bacterium]
MQIKVIEKVIQILEVICISENDVKLKNIIQKTNLNQATAYHIISTLLYHGLISKNNKDKKFSIGPKFLYLAQKYFDGTYLYNELFLKMEKLSQKINENSYIFLLDYSFPILLKSFKCTHSVRPVDHSIQLTQSHASAWGKLLLSTLSEAKLVEHCQKYKLNKFTKNTITNINNLKKELENVKKVGYSFDNEETEEGLYCIGLKKEDHIKNTIFGLVISIPKQRFSEKLKIKIIEELKTK